MVTLLSYARICSMPDWRRVAADAAGAPGATTAKTARAPIASVPAARTGALRNRIERQCTARGYKGCFGALHVGCCAPSDHREDARMANDWRVLPPSPFATLPDAVTAGAERGLLEAARIGPN